MLCIIDIHRLVKHRETYTGFLIYEEQLVSFSAKVRCSK